MSATNASEDDKAKAKDKIQEIWKESMDEFIAYLYLENADKSRYGSIL